MQAELYDKRKETATKRQFPFSFMIRSREESDMNYSAIKYCDIANGVGVRTVLFVSGCRNHCEGCFQPETWSFENGDPFTEKEENEIIASLQPDYIKGLTLLGGDPFEPENQKALLPFMRKVKAACPGKDVWAYTGYVLDRDLIQDGKCYTEDTEELLSMIDILVDGPFIMAQKDITLQFKGSKNQRVIDCKHYCKTGEIIEVM